MQNLFEFIVKNKLTSKYTDNADCVDLDLPSGTLWAICNIGASKPEEYGGYYQWGGLEDMSNKNCDWTTAPFNDGKEYYDKDTWNKYKDKVLDSNNNLKLDYDVAYKESKGMLRMPTKDEAKELIEYTDSDYYELNGVKGRKFISKKNKSKWIFIPFSNYRYKSRFYDYDSCYYLWSSSVYINEHNKAYFYFFNYNNKCIMPDDNICGFCVRGIKYKNL